MNYPTGATNRPGNSYSAMPGVRHYAKGGEGPNELLCTGCVGGRQRGGGRLGEIVLPESKQTPVTVTDCNKLPGATNIAVLRSAGTTTYCNVTDITAVVTVETGDGPKAVPIPKTGPSTLFFIDPPANWMNARRSRSSNRRSRSSSRRRKKFREEFAPFKKEIEQHLTENDNDKIHDILYSRANHRRHPHINVHTPLTTNAQYLNTYPLIFEHLQKKGYTFTPV